MGAEKKESRLEDAGEPVPTYDEALKNIFWGIVATIGGVIGWFNLL